MCNSASRSEGSISVAVQFCEPTTKSYIFESICLHVLLSMMFSSVRSGTVSIKLTKKRAIARSSFSFVLSQQFSCAEITFQSKKSICMNCPSFPLTYIFLMGTLKRLEMTAFGERSSFFFFIRICGSRHFMLNARILSLVTYTILWLLWHQARLGVDHKTFVSHIAGIRFKAF